MSLRNASILLGSVLLALLLSASALADSRYETADYSAEMSLTGHGLTSTVTISLENRTAAPVTLLLRDIAFNGECTGYSARFEVPAGQTSRSVSFRRADLSPITVCDAGIAILGADGNVLSEETLTVLPYGERGVKRPALTDFAGAVAAYDDEAASLLVLAPETKDARQRTLWFYNKSDRLMRLRIDGVLADGQLTDIGLTMQALPATGQFASLTLPESLPDVLLLTLTGYSSAQGDRPAFRTTYEYRLSAPVPVTTLAPVNTPPVQIGTVTIRRSGAVNVREKDTTDSKKIGSAKAGKTYPCYGISPAGWYLIRLEDGTEGYVTNTLTTLQRN